MLLAKLGPLTGDRANSCVDTQDRNHMGQIDTNPLIDRSMQTCVLAR